MIPSQSVQVFWTRSHHPELFRPEQDMVENTGPREIYMPGSLWPCLTQQQVAWDSGHRVHLLLQRRKEFGHLVPQWTPPINSSHTHIGFRSMHRIFDFGRKHRRFFYKSRQDCCKLPETNWGCGTPCQTWHVIVYINVDDVHRPSWMGRPLGCSFQEITLRHLYRWVLKYAQKKCTNVNVYARCIPDVYDRSSRYVSVVNFVSRQVYAWNCRIVFTETAHLAPAIFQTLMRASRINWK